MFASVLLPEFYIYISDTIRQFHGHPTSCKMSTHTHSPGRKWPECETECLHPSSTKVYIAWNATSILSVHLYGIVLRHTGNFTFTFMVHTMLFCLFRFIRGPDVERFFSGPTFKSMFWQL